MYGFRSSLGVDTTRITVKAREINIHRTILPWREPNPLWKQHNFKVAFDKEKTSQESFVCCTAGRAARNQRQELWREGTVYAQRSHSRIDGRRLEERLPTKHLVWETPISVEPSVTAPLDFRQRNKETRHCPIIVCTIAAVKLAQRSLFGRQRFASGAETERGVQTYSMSDNKVSPSQEGCWLSSGVQRIETKVTILWLWEGHESGGQTGTTFATWPIYITAKACLVAKLECGSINRMG